MENKYRRTKTTVSLINYHFVFCPRYRRKIFDNPNVETRFKEIVKNICEELEIEIIAIECDKDHTHIFLNCLPTLSPSDIMNKIKGVSSKLIREEFEELNRMPSLWTRSYFVSTAGNVSSETIKKYVEEQKTRYQGCESMSNFTLTLELKAEKWQEDILDKRLNIGRQMYNACLGELYKRYNTMTEGKEYKAVINMPKGKERNREFSRLNKKYGLTEYSLHAYVKPIQHHFKDNIDSFTAQKIATRVFRAFEKYMFHQAKKVYFKKYNELNSLEGKSNKTGIRFIDDRLVWNKLEIPVIIKKNDEYAQMALESEIKYCRVLRRFIRGKYKYYIQLILDGVPPIKINKDTGEIKNNMGEGRVGLDIGTQTIAISNKHDVKLLELAPEIVNIEQEKRILQRKLDRQRRANNLDNFNEDGTVKKGVRIDGRLTKLKWNESNKYIKTRNKLREIQRKQASIRKQSHERLANYILNLGDKIYVEDMNYKGLQARAKETTINKKTGKYNKKKRFGKSLANKAPSMFLTILDNKLKFNNTQLYKIDTWSVKASQYNHIEDEYIKKSLSERWNDFEECKVQRDLYSSFLIMNVKDNLKEIDRDLCIETFDNFTELHDKEVERIQNSNSRLISSMGI